MLQTKIPAIKLQILHSMFVGLSQPAVYFLAISWREHYYKRGRLVRARTCLIGALKSSYVNKGLNYDFVAIKNDIGANI